MPAYFKQTLRIFEVHKECYIRKLPRLKKKSKYTLRNIQNVDIFLIKCYKYSKYIKNASSKNYGISSL